jgi:hypothetical protein
MPIPVMLPNFDQARLVHLVLALRCKQEDKAALQRQHDFEVEIIF